MRWLIPTLSKISIHLQFCKLLFFTDFCRFLVLNVFLHFTDMAFLHISIFNFLDVISVAVLFNFFLNVMYLSKPIFYTDWRALILVLVKLFKTQMYRYLFVDNQTLLTRISLDFPPPNIYLLFFIAEILLLLISTRFFTRHPIQVLPRILALPTCPYSFIW